MLLAAALLSLALLLVAVLVPQRLARARWPQRSPGTALLLWQALGLTGGLGALTVLGTLALAPGGSTHAEAVRRTAAGAVEPPPWTGVVLALAVLLLLRLLTVLLASAARTLRARHRHRVLVDLLGTRHPLLPSARVVDHEVPVAYCLPGLRARVVLSRGVLALLREDELRAVLAHEDAHVEQRHDLVVLPFVALTATFPRVPAVRTASSEVGRRVERLAHDPATPSHDRTTLARALWKVGTGSAPSGSLAAGGDAVLLRARRLLDPADPLPRAARLAVAVAAVTVLALSPSALLLPVLLD